jgi:hypothetical protein
MRTSLLGTQARPEEKSPLQEGHVADVHYGKAVNAEPENPDNSSFTRRSANLEVVGEVMAHQASI